MLTVMNYMCTGFKTVKDVKQNRISVKIIISHF